MNNKEATTEYTPAITKEEFKGIAETMFKQMGGNKFIAMCCRYNMPVVSNHKELSITFHLGTYKPHTGGVKAKWLVVQYDNASDTYNMYFKNIKRASKKNPYPKPYIAKEFKGVYNDMLQSIFTETTGLATHL